jgi:hypothetical protein
MNYRFGKRPPVTDVRTLKLTRYSQHLPPNPPAADFLSNIPAPLPMYGNDTLGDCVAAAAGHMIEGWTEYAGKFFQPSESDIIAFYEFSGYTPGDPSSDQGWELLPALNVWRQTGIAGHKIVAYAQLTTGDYGELRQAVAVFGNAYIGLNLPDYVVPDSGSPDWTTIPWFYQDGQPADPNNGHCVPVMKYSAEKKRAWFISWAAEMVMNPPFYSAYSDEAYVAITEDWIAVDNESPSGFDMAQLMADLTAVTSLSQKEWLIQQA